MRVLLTVEGDVRLREELQQLKRVDRPAVIEAIAEARAHGDLSENAEYHAAREQQGFIEGRIADLEANIDEGMISHSSPIAKALIGKRQDDEIEFQAPGGVRRYEVLAVRYRSGTTANEDSER